MRRERERARRESGLAFDVHLQLVLLIHLNPKKLAFVFDKFIEIYWLLIYNKEPTKVCDAGARKSL